MVRETFGQAVDDALAQLEYAGVPRDAVAVLRRRLRADKAIGAAAIDLLAAWDGWMTLPGGALGQTVEQLREAVEASGKRERVRA